MTRGSVFDPGTRPLVTGYNTTFNYVDTYFLLF